MKQPQADYRITLDGRDLTRALDPRLVSLSLVESRGGEADTLELVLDDSDGRLDLPACGAELTLQLGWIEPGLVDKGRFTIDEVSFRGAPDTITVRARAGSMTDAMSERREKSWHRTTLGAIVQALAARYHLKPVIPADLAKVAIAHIDQTHESDMSFITRIAKRYDAVASVKSGNLLFMPIGRGRTASGKPLPALAITRASGDRHQYSLAKRDEFGGVRAYYHSTGSAKRKSVEVGGGKDAKNTKVLPETYPDEAAARAAAQAEYQRTVRSQATLDYALALGRPDLYPEMPVNLSGFKPEIDETVWLAKKVTHKIDAGGFTTTLELEVKGDPPKQKSGSGGKPKGQ